MAGRQADAPCPAQRGTRNFPTIGPTMPRQGLRLRVSRETWMPSVCPDSPANAGKMPTLCAAMRAWKSLFLRAVPAKTRTTASWPRRLPKSPPARVPRPHCWSWRTTTFRSTTPIWKPGARPRCHPLQAGSAQPRGLDHLLPRIQRQLPGPAQERLGLGLQPRQGRPGVGRWRAAISRQGRGHVQRFARWSWRPARSVPSGSVALESGVLAGSAQPCRQPGRRCFRCTREADAPSRPTRCSGGVVPGAVGCSAPARLRGKLPPGPPAAGRQSTSPRGFRCH